MLWSSKNVLYLPGIKPQPSISIQTAYAPLVMLQINSVDVRVNKNFRGPCR
jgi:hypothetical protein